MPSVAHASFRLSNGKPSRDTRKPLHCAESSSLYLLILSHKCRTYFQLAGLLSCVFCCGRRNLSSRIILRGNHRPVQDPTARAEAGGLHRTHVGSPSRLTYFRSRVLRTHCLRPVPVGRWADVSMACNTFPQMLLRLHGMVRALPGIPFRPASSSIVLAHCLWLVVVLSVLRLHLPLSPSHLTRLARHPASVYCSRPAQRHRHLPPLNAPAADLNVHSTTPDLAHAHCPILVPSFMCPCHAGLALRLWPPHNNGVF